MRVMVYSMIVIGGITSFKGVISFQLLLGVSIVLVSSVMYLITVSIKIFAKATYIQVFFEGPETSQWETLSPKFYRKGIFVYETQVYAILYFLVSLGFLYLFHSNYKELAIIFFSIMTLCCATLFTIPFRRNTYIKRWMQVKKEHNSETID